MAKISLKYRLVGGIILVVLLLGVIGTFIVRPTISKIKELEKEISKIEIQLEQRYQDSQKLKRTLHELEAVKLGVDKFTQTTVKPGSELEIITTFETLATEHDISQALSIADEKEGNQEFYQLSFLNNGSYQNHLDYLRSIELLPYYVIIDSIKLEKRNSEADAPITASFIGKIYVEKQI